MKKLLIVAALLFLATNAMAAAESTITAARNVSADNTEVNYVYSVATVAQGETTTFLLAVPFSAGRILDFDISCASPDFDYWLSESESVTITSVHSRIAMQGANLTHSPPLFDGRTYRNNDTPEAPALYLHIKNNSVIETGTTTVSITSKK